MVTLWWIGVGAGVGIAALHAAVRLLFRRRARRYDDERSAPLLEAVSLLARMGVVLLLTTLTLLLAPVPPAPFVTSLLGALLLSILGDVAVAARRNDTHPS